MGLLSEPYIQEMDGSFSPSREINSTVTNETPSREGEGKGKVKMLQKKEKGRILQKRGKEKNLQGKEEKKLMQSELILFYGNMLVFEPVSYQISLFGPSGFNGQFTIQAWREG